MKVKKNSYLDTLIKCETKGGIIPYIERFLTVHPYAGVYEVNDEEYQRSESTPEEMHFHPSGDCSKCPRLLYFERSSEYSKKLVDDITPANQAIFKMGDAVHAMLQAWFKAWNDLDGFPRCVGNEVRIADDELNIGGYIDSVIVFPDTDDEIPIEIKSISSYQFSILKGPKADHKMQVSCYIMETGAPYGIVLYYNKDTSEMKEFRVEPMDMMPVLMKWGKVRSAIASKDMSCLECGCSREESDTVFKRCPARAFCREAK